jgi:hypothetical protein
MITMDPTRSRTIRNIALGATLLLAAAVTGCGSSPQSMAGVAPSAQASIAAASSDAGGTFGTLKDGHDKGKPVTPPAPTTGTTPATGTIPDVDDHEGHGHGGGNEGPGDDQGPGNDHGNGRQTQIEGIAASVTGTCPTVTIIIGTQTITTNAMTDFQRADCALIAAGTRLHVAGTTTTTTTTTATGTTTTTTTFVASSVRTQGPEGGDDDAADDNDDVTPPAPPVTTALLTAAK